MSNFSAFSPDHLKKLLEPFAPGMAQHITPIKFEALTPDCFLLLFRTTGNNDDEHFFVSLETDFENSLAGAECTIVEWHGPIVKFWPLQTKSNVDDYEHVEDYKTATSGAYFSMLAEVERPTHKGYWAEAMKIMPGDNIGEKIKHYSKKEQANIRKALTSILQHKTDPSASFLESLQAKRGNTIVNDINKTDIAVSLYVQPNGGVEFFYNYVHPAVGGRERKPKDKT